MRKLGWVAALSALALGVTGVAEAQIARHGRPLYGHAEVNRGFMPDPHVMQGVMGGSLQASTLSPTCRGYVNPQPSHVIRSRTGFQNLRVVVSGQGDSTLMIMLPNGAVLCDDDSGGGRNPLIQLSAPPGEIRVWVGVWSSSDQGNPYVLGLTELAHVNASHLGGVVGRPPPMPQPPPMPGVMPNGQPLFGTLHLRRGFMPDPHVASGQAGGAIAASSIDGSCRGYITAQPSHVIMTQSGFGRLRVLVNSGDLDSTLVVMAPNGQIFCNDDGNASSGLNPVVELSTGPGPIRVWVGAYSSGRVGPYNIGFTELGHVRTPNIPAPGAYAQPTPQPQPMPHPMPVPPVHAAAQLVPMQVSIPVTLLGPGLEPGTVALWEPGGGPPTQITISGRTIMAGGAPLATLPPSMREPVVTVMQQRGGWLVVRVEQPPMSRRDRGEAMLLRVSWRGQPVVDDRWDGRFGQRGPRWAR